MTNNTRNSEALAQHESSDPALRDWLLAPLQRATPDSDRTTDASAEPEPAIEGGAGAETHQPALDSDAESDDGPLAAALVAISAEAAERSRPAGERWADIPGPLPESAELPEAEEARGGDDADAGIPHTLVPSELGALEATRTTAETLAPQVMPSDAADPTDEDLAVLGLGDAQKNRRTLLGRVLVAAALLALLLLLGRGLLRGKSEAADTRPAEANPSYPAVDEPLPPPPAEATAQAVPEEEPEAAPEKGQKRGRRRAPPQPSADEDPAGPWGPSVARFPDLPQDVLSRLAREAKQGSGQAARAESSAGRK